MNSRQQMKMKIAATSLTIMINHTKARAKRKSLLFWTFERIMQITLNLMKGPRSLKNIARELQITSMQIK
jgi:hypothetical protein